MAQVAAEIDAVKPTHIVNCAGLTGRPNVDWCEFHRDEVRVTTLSKGYGCLA